MISGILESLSFVQTRFTPHVDTELTHFTAELAKETEPTTPRVSDRLDFRLTQLVKMALSEAKLITEVVSLLMQENQLSLTLGQVIGLSYFNEMPYKLKLNSLKKQLHIGIIKALSLHGVTKLMRAAQAGDQQAYRHLLGQLKLILTDFFKSEFKDKFDPMKMADTVLTKMHELRHTYHESQDFLDWVFAITKQTLVQVQHEKKEAYALKKVTQHRISAVQLAQLAIVPISSKEPPSDATP